MIKHELNGKFTVKLSEKATSSLSSYKPKGCPFYGYNCLEMVKDLIHMYSWKIRRGQSMTLKEFVRLLQSDGIEKAVIYGNDIIDLVENC